MNYYLIKNTVDHALFESEGQLYPIFEEKYGREAINVKKEELVEITNKEDIEALNKYLKPYEDNKPKIYMAGPLFNEGDRYTNQINSDILRKNGFTTFLLQDIVITNNSSPLVKSACFYMDFKAIKECDYLLANCNGIDIDSGTAAEIGLAYGLNKNIILYKSDVRNYYNNTYKLNNFVGGLVDNIVYSSIEEILDLLLK